jgi:hypothetical protein
VAKGARSYRCTVVIPGMQVAYLLGIDADADMDGPTLSLKPMLYRKERPSMYREVVSI